MKSILIVTLALVSSTVFAQQAVDAELQAKALECCAVPASTSGGSDIGSSHAKALADLVEGETFSATIHQDSRSGLYFVRRPDIGKVYLTGSGAVNKLKIRQLVNSRATITGAWDESGDVPYLNFVVFEATGK